MIKTSRAGGPGIRGFIKIGMPTAKDSSRKGAPIKFDHFEVTTREREGAAEALEVDVDLMRSMVEASKREGSSVTLCGGCPRSKELGFKEGLPNRLGVYAVDDDLETTFPSRLGWYRGNTLYCYGEGNDQPAHRRKTEIIDGQQTFGEYDDQPGCGDTCPDLLEGRCKPNAKLRVGLAQQPVVGAVHEFRTTSWNSYRNMAASLGDILQLTGGVLRYVPLVLELREQTLQRPTGGSTKAFIVSIYFPGSPRELLQQASEVYKLLEPAKRELLKLSEGQWDESPQEAAEVAAEFYPDPDADLPVPVGPHARPMSIDPATAPADGEWLPPDDPDDPAPPPATEPEPVPGCATCGEIIEGDIVIENGGAHHPQCSSSGRRLNVGEIAQVRKLLSKHKLGSSDKAQAKLTEVTGREIATMQDMTVADFEKLKQALGEQPEQKEML